MNKKKRERIIAAVVVLAFELAVTALITVAVGVVLVPMVEAQRGYNAMGGEWVFLMAVAIAAYNALHSYIFRAAYRRQKETRCKNWYGFCRVRAMRAAND